MEGCIPYLQVPNQYKKPASNIWRNYKAIRRIHGCRWQHGQGLESISSYAFLINGGAMFWALKKQEIVFLSTIESEYIAAIHAMKHYGCAYLLEKFSFLSKCPLLSFQITNPLSHLQKNHQYHTCMKHINIHFHFICWIVDNSKIQLIFCPTNHMVANTLTKVLSFSKSSTSWPNLDCAWIEGECWNWQPHVQLHCHQINHFPDAHMLHIHFFL